MNLISIGSSILTKEILRNVIRHLTPFRSVGHRQIVQLFTQQLSKLFHESTGIEELTMNMISSLVLT